MIVGISLRLRGNGCSIEDGAGKSTCLVSKSWLALLRQTRLLFLTVFLHFTSNVALAGSPNIVVTIAPVHSLVAQITEGVVTPELLIPASASPHTFSLKPSQAVALAKADLVIWVGDVLESRLVSLMKRLSVEVKELELISVEGIELLAPREDKWLSTDEHIQEVDDIAGEHGHAHEHGHADEHGHAHEHGHADEHGHAHEVVDPHLWLDPHIAERWLEEITGTLVRIDPDNAQRYRENLRKARSDIRILLEELHISLTFVKKKPFITSHDFSQYFDRRFGLNNLGSLMSSTAKKPGSATLVRIDKHIKRSEVVCILVDPQHPSKLAGRLAERHSLRLVELDPLGVEFVPGKSLYGELLRNYGQNLTKCLQ